MLGGGSGFYGVSELKIEFDMVAGIPFTGGMLPPTQRHREGGICVYCFTLISYSDWW